MRTTLMLSAWTLAGGSVLSFTPFERTVGFVVALLSGVTFITFLRANRALSKADEALAEQQRAMKVARKAAREVRRIAERD